MSPSSCVNKKGNALVRIRGPSAVQLCSEIFQKTLIITETADIQRRNFKNHL